MGKSVLVARPLHEAPWRGDETGGQPVVPRHRALRMPRAGLGSARERRPTMVGAFRIFLLSGLMVIAGCAASGQRATLYPEPVSDPDISVDVYKADKAYAGTTLLADNHREHRPRILELDMHGKILWQYVLPAALRSYTNPGFDVERLSNGHVLFVLPLRGVYEIDRSGTVVWEYRDSKVTHDADRLPNGNTLVAFGGNDGKSDAQVKEVDPEGRVVWTWKARDHFTGPEYEGISDQGWTHTNAVTRLENGHTLISLRNFNLIAEVDRTGSVVRTIGKGILAYQHDPEVQPNGHILVANHKRPHRVIEIDPEANRVVWSSKGFPREMCPVRDADRLPNGNILITAAKNLLELTREGELVWRLNLDVTFQDRRQAPALGFYKAQRD